MSFTFDTSSTDAATLQIARVRNHTSDTGNGDEDGGTVGVDYFMTDERIALFLGDEADATLADTNVAKLAAADALDSLATNEAYVQKVQKTMGEETDGAKTADSIRAHAKTLRAQVKEARALDSASGSSSFSVQMRRGRDCGDEYTRYPRGCC